jgi:hypothetical protein
VADVMAVSMVSAIARTIPSFGAMCPLLVSRLSNFYRGIIGGMCELLHTAALVQKMHCSRGAVALGPRNGAAPAPPGVGGPPFAERNYGICRRPIIRLLFRPLLGLATTSRYPILLATRGMLAFVPMAGKYPFQGLLAADARLDQPTPPQQHH